MAKELILAKYGEMALKGLNRGTFEDILMKNLRRRLKKFGAFKLNRAQSTIYMEPLSEDIDLDEVLEHLQCVFGIAALCRACVCEKTMEDISAKAVPYLEEVLLGAKTFKVEAKRADKAFPLKSPEICAELGGILLDAYPHLSVDVRHPDVTVMVEIRDTHAFVHGANLKGAGGLPVGSSGKAVLYYNLLLLRIAYYFSSVEAPPLADRYTDETATATRSAQQLLGLEQTGVADADTWTAVEALSLQLAAHAPNPDRDVPPSTAYPGRAIAEGSAGQEVGQVERWLNRRAQLSCGEDYVADNNRFGAADAAAVRAVQQQAGLQPVNGIVYRETWHALQAQCADPCGCEKEE